MRENLNPFQRFAKHMFAITIIKRQFGLLNLKARKNARIGIFSNKVESWRRTGRRTTEAYSSSKYAIITRGKYVHATCSFSFFFSCLQINYSLKRCETFKEGRVGRAYLVMRSLDIRFHVAGRIEWSVNGKCVIVTRVVRHPPFLVPFPLRLSVDSLTLLTGRPNFRENFV